MFIRPTTKASGSIFDIHENADELLLYPVHEDIACPWDAEIYVEGDKVVLIGSVGGGSANNYKNAGFCRCECSVDNFDNFYKLEVPGDNEELLNAIKEAGWEEV